MNRLNAAVAPCLLLVLLVNSGCIYRQGISYSLRGVKPAPGSPFKDQDLRVAPFEDARIADKASTRWYHFVVPRVPKNDEDWFYNSDRFYKKEQVSKKISKMIAKHLEAAKVFRSVTFEEEKPASGTWVLTGKVTKFEGLKEPTIDPLLAGQMGLMGAIALSLTKTDYRGHVLLTDVRLLRPDATIAWEGEIIGERSGENMADPDGWNAYIQADEALKVAVADLVKKLSALPPTAAHSPSLKRSKP